MANKITNIKNKIRELAVQEWHEDGSVEIDANAKVSLSYDEAAEGNVLQGAYVQAWVWVDFKAETKS